jgi:hypothetical protein
MTDQALDGSPDAIIRRLSSFLLIPVGTNRQGFAYPPLVGKFILRRSPGENPILPSRRINRDTSLT